MNKWKLAFWICLVLLIGSVFWGFYNIIDQGVTITHMMEGYTDTENDLNILIQLINETDLSKKEVEMILKNHKLYEFMEFEKDTISLDRVLLYFKNGKLDQVGKQW